MRLCRFDDDRLGVVAGGLVHDITSIQQEIRASAPYDMRGDAVIAALPDWRERMEAAAAGVPGTPLSQVRILSPVARPGKVMAAPTNYEKHIAEMAARRANEVIAPAPAIGQAGIFLKANSSVVGASEGMPMRFPERNNEHELEIVVIIGKAGTDIPFERALEHVAGYSLGLDMTVRGKEDRSFRKSPDGYSPVGPWMVTADEIADPDNLDIELDVNGVVRQKSNTRHLIYSVRKLIEFASSYYTLYPGDLYFTGTPEGVGPVKPGDRIRARCPAIGELVVDVRAHKPGQPGD